MNGSYQFENLEGRHAEAALLGERARLRMEGFPSLLRAHGFPDRGRVLEVGCGLAQRSRLMALTFPGANITAVDRSTEMLDLAKQSPMPMNLSLAQADIYELPFADETFDFVYARLVFMHLNDPLKAIANLKRVLKPGGRLLIEDADRDCMFFEPAPASFADFWSKVQAGQRRLGGDPNVGRKLAPYLRQSGFQTLNVDVKSILGGGDDIDFLVRTLMPSLNIYLLPEQRADGQAAINDLAQLSKQPDASFYHFWFAVSGEKQ